MSVTLSNSDAISYLFIAFLGFIILRRAYLLTHGVPVSTARVVVLPAFYALLYIAELAAIGLVAPGSSLATPTYLSFAVDAALLVVGTWVAYEYTLRHLETYRAPGETAWSYRMSALLPVAYVALFFARVAIETAVLNETPLEFPTAKALAGVSILALYSLFLVDALWGLSTGFLIGRSVAVYREWQKHLDAGAPDASSSLP